MEAIKQYCKTDLLRDVLYDILGSILYALGVYTFAVGADFAPGGVSGLSVIVHHFTGFPIGTCTLLLNLPIILLCYRVMGKLFLIKSLKTMAISAFFLDVVFVRLPMYSGNPLLACLFAGACMGIGLSLIYLRGSSTGGSDFFILSLHKLFPHRSIAQITMIADCSVVLLGGLVFGRVDALLLGILATITCSLVIDNVLSGSMAGKMVTIITSHGQEIADVINTEVDRGSTMIRATGSYTGQERQVLMCACSKSQMVVVRRIAYQVDARAIVTISSYDEAFGEGFQDPHK